MLLLTADWYNWLNKSNCWNYFIGAAKFVFASGWLNNCFICTINCLFLLQNSGLLYRILFCGERICNRFILLSSRRRVDCKWLGAHLIVTWLSCLLVNCLALFGLDAFVDWQDMLLGGTCMFRNHICWEGLCLYIIMVVIRYIHWWYFYILARNCYITRC